jgi:nicotinamide phosphoribosyltransferase
MYEINPMLAIDSYKLAHMTMYPKNTTRVYCNLTARNFTHLFKIIPNDFQFFNGKAVVFGLSGSIQEIKESFDKNFFAKDIDVLMEEFEETIRPFIGDNDSTMLHDKFRQLHTLGYLPLVFKTLPEGSQVGPNVPMMTWTNTHDDYAWLPNYLETYISSQVWKLITAATIAKIYKSIFDYYADVTGVDRAYTTIQGHDFSSFIGTDAVSAIGYIKKYYNPDKDTVIGVSVPASEHSVMCMGGNENEIDTYSRLLTQYPKGIVSIVSDTWDYWDLIKNGTMALKEQILARQPDSLGFAKTVFRPDSGEPVDIVCGTKNIIVRKGAIDNRTSQEKGSVEILAENFGFDTNEAGFKTVNQKVGLIYGDSITPIRAHNILRKLKNKGFASDNIILGIGSFTYQYLTRDTLGMAVKATAGVIDGKVVKIFKQPKTDSGKNSAKGYMRVDNINGEYKLTDNLENDNGGCLKEIFRDGKFKDLPTFDEIRERLAN